MMDRGTQDSLLLSELVGLGSLQTRTTEGDPQRNEVVHTVYAQVPAVLEDSGYRHIYVTVDTPQDVTSLTQSLSTQQEVNLNQSNIVTVAVPTSQLMNDGSTLVIQPETIGISSESNPTATEHTQTGHQTQVFLSEANTVPVVTNTETLPQKDQEGHNSTTQESLNGRPSGREKADTGSGVQTICVASGSVEEVAGHQEDVLDLVGGGKVTEKLSATVPLVVCRCEARRNNVKTAQQIFTKVQANLANRLMETIPGCSASFLHQFTTQHDMQLLHQEKQSAMQVSGDLHKLLCLHDNLSQLMSGAQPRAAPPYPGPPDPVPVPQRHVGLSGPAQPIPVALAPLARSAGQPDQGPTKDKAVLCDLPQPQFSRSGRRIKRRNLDHPMDRDDGVMGLGVADDKPTVSRPPTPAKRRRGRPPKNSKPEDPSQIHQEKTQLIDVPMTSQTAGNENFTAVVTSRSEEDADAMAIHIEAVVTSDVQSGCDVRELTLSDDVGVEHIVSHEETALDSDVTRVKDAGEVGDVGESDEDVPYTNNLSEKENNQDGASPDTSDPPHSPAKDGAPYTTFKTRTIPAGIVLGRKRHKKDYESLAPFKFHCNTCSFKSKRKSHYLKHLLIHTKKSLPVLQCSQCSFTTIRLSHLRRHQLSHSSNLFTCKVCSYRTDDPKRLARHHRIKHVSARNPPANNVIYQCDSCEYKTLKSYQYYRHLRCHSALCSDSTAQTCSSYQCPLCPYKTQRKEHYSRHAANVHTDCRPYLCDLCGKAFKRPDALRQHKLIHQDKQSLPFKYTCQVCFKGFMSHAHMVEHRTIHTDERTYLCEVCGAAFKTRSVQRKHVQTIHQNPRAHSCAYCDKRFNTKYALQRHLRTHNTPGMRTLSLAMETLGGGRAVAVLPETGEAPQMMHELRDQGEQQEVEQEVQAMVAETIVTGEDGAAATIEQQYEEGGDAGVRQLPQTAYIQTTSEETTALLYLTSLPTY